jgi:putative ABC transport system permease protein
VNLGSLAVRGLFRHKFRNTLTIIGVAVAVVTFMLLRTVNTAWSVAADFAAKDRIATRHKMTFVIPLPKRYIDTVRAADGITAATWANWFGAKNPNDPNDFFPSMAVDPQTFLEVYDEAAVPDADRARWFEDRKGALVGDILAKKLNLKVGDRITLEGTIYPGQWDFNISGIYKATRKSLDRSQFLFHWDYLNESVQPYQKDQIGWIVARVDDPGRSAEIATAIDRTFDIQDVQTLSMSERAMNTSFMGMLSGILRALDIVAGIILVILLMILGNTIGMGVRERTHEYGVLKALGFTPSQIALSVVGEATVMGLAAGALGLSIAYPFVNYGIGRWLAENMGGMFPYFEIAPSTAVAGFGAAALLGALSGIIPARRAARLTVTDALRRVA